MKLLVFFLIMITPFGQTKTLTANTGMAPVAVELEQETKKEITVEELPAKVIEAYEQSEYSQWDIVQVFLVGASTENWYELHLSVEDETIVLIADVEGHLHPRVDG